MKRLIALLMAVLMITTITATAFASTNTEKLTADALHSLGLFRGVGDNADGTPNYGLDYNLTRSQAVILLVRMLGKENEANKGTYSHPFKDTADWYDKYVGYAYVNKLTNGTSDKTFSGDIQTTAQMFVTFCLRSLGYDDMGEKPDFSWDKACEKANEIGIKVDFKGVLLRSDAIIIFWDTLNTKLKGSNMTLAEKLEADGVFTKSEFENATRIQKGITQQTTSKDNGAGTNNSELNTSSENNTGNNIYGENDAVTDGNSTGNNTITSDNTNEGEISVDNSTTDLPKIPG